MVVSGYSVSRCLTMPSVSIFPSVEWTNILTCLGLRTEDWWKVPWKHLNVFLKDRKDISAYDMAMEKDLRLI